MKAFLLVCGLLQSFDFALTESCLPRLGYVCKEIPTSYPADMSSLVLWVSNVGEINSTVFNNTHLASVTSLTMEKNGITAIAAGAFDKFQNLKMLNLHGNDISLVTSAWFTHREVLEDFNLSSNRIASLNDDAFHGLLGLLKLNLSQNQIQTISTGTFHSLSILSHLDLSNNKLSYLSVETLRAVNNTKICLNGNPWNCSYTEFNDYIRELQRASLLENEMEVLCDTPSCLRGVPVWNVSKCVEHLTAVDLTTGSSHTLKPTPVQPHINLSVLISLLVVLCALVLVICVLSVLYHRKREQKHLQTIRPSPEGPECGNQAQSDCSEALERPKNAQLLVSDLIKKPYYRTEVVQRLDQTVLNAEKMSQVYQIYGTGICQNGDRNNRAKSAGPVLSRTDVFGRQLETKVEDQKELKQIKHEEMCANEKDNYEMFLDGMMEASEEQECGTEGELQKMERKHLKVEKVDGGGDEFITTLERREKHKENQMMGLVEENAKKQEFLHNDDDTVVSEEEFKDNLISSLARHELSQPGSDDCFQPCEDSETIPYLTIGTDPESQILNQIPTEASTQLVPSRPIRRILTWPPTAVQWKKQWAQNQQILSVLPKLVFVTGCQHQNGTFPFSTSSTSPEDIVQHQVNIFPSSISSASPEGVLQGSCSGSNTIHKSARQDATDIKTVELLKEISESVANSYIQNLPNSAQNSAKLIEAQCGIINHNPLLNSKDLVHSSPLSEEMHDEESVNPSEESHIVKRGSQTRKKDQTPKSEQMVSKSERQSRIRDKEGRPALKGPREHSGSGSRVPPSGGSPSDDSLLVDNEYAFIDLLHEVVENHGRWTRERWRQSHMNKQKHKPSGKSH
ncbi:uncharacterized protein LOC108423611 isoform X1 [Pygocentrus nattereri]|uniref:LRRCT domain-containing protein n=1 Tax=Pygocentrus nattereri TaxID=42514 RepID=A0A3B4DGL3_PYGNA|nr:uncharacterized protein LOC108423611 isoform X1 [Pygocentrus nattereri]